jgi:hypothetical protein
VKGGKAAISVGRTLIDNFSHSLPLMMEYRKLAPKRFSSRQIDEDAKYWKAFKVTSN